MHIHLNNDVFQQRLRMFREGIRKILEQKENHVMYIYIEIHTRTIFELYENDFEFAIGAQRRINDICERCYIQ